MTRSAILLLTTAMLALPQRPGTPPPSAPLWPGGAPGALGDADEDKPSLTAYLPTGIKTGTAVVVCPGGGYRNLAIDHEGHQVARWFNSIGVAAFVLKYRLGPRYHHPIELGDAQRAIRIVRSRAAEYGIAPIAASVLMNRVSPCSEVGDTPGTPQIDCGQIAPAPQK